MKIRKQINRCKRLIKEIQNMHTFSLCKKKKKIQPNRFKYSKKTFQCPINT